MNIQDLTRGKYYNLTHYFIPQELGIEELKESKYIKSIEDFLSVWGKNLKDLERLVTNIPVFLVESSMANEYVAVPGNDCIVKVPEDRGLIRTSDFNVEEWLHHQPDYQEDDDAIKHDDPREWTSKGFAISDYLGAYIFEGKDILMPQRIFIWVDKIEEFVNRECSKNVKDIEATEYALFLQVLFHEVSHAIMDTNSYGINSCPRFNYTNPIYRFVEEALANSMSLELFYIHYNNICAYHKKQIAFVETFVRNQEDCYALGMELYNKIISKCSGVFAVITKHRYGRLIGQWMYAKVFFCYAIARRLALVWKSKSCESFLELFCCVNIHIDGVIAVRDHLDKWGIIEIEKHDLVVPYSDLEEWRSISDEDLQELSDALYNALSTF